MHHVTPHTLQHNSSAAQITMQIEFMQQATELHVVLWSHCMELIPCLSFLVCAMQEQCYAALEDVPQVSHGCGYQHGVAVGTSMQLPAESINDAHFTWLLCSQIAVAVQPHPMPVHGGCLLMCMCMVAACSCASTMHQLRHSLGAWS